MFKHLWVERSMLSGLTKKTCILVIGERSEPLSDKLGGEICIATRALVCIYIMRTA